MTGRAKLPALAREGQKVLVTAVCTFDTGKSIMEVATVEIPVNDAGDIRAKEAILPLKPFLKILPTKFRAIYGSEICRIARSVT